MYGDNIIPPPRQVLTCLGGGIMYNLMAQYKIILWQDICTSCQNARILLISIQESRHAQYTYILTLYRYLGMPGLVIDQSSINVLSSP